MDLDTKISAVEREALYSAFVVGYRDAMLFTMDEDGLKRLGWSFCCSGEFVPEPGLIDAIAPEAWIKLCWECCLFFAKTRELWDDHDDDGFSARAERAAQVGRDFWFTRNYHGIGYWGRPELYSMSCADSLTQAAERTGERSAYVGDDGRIYID